MKPLQTLSLSYSQSNCDVELNCFVSSWNLICFPPMQMRFFCAFETRLDFLHSKLSRNSRSFCVRTQLKVRFLRCYVNTSCMKINPATRERCLRDFSLSSFWRSLCSGTKSNDEGRSHETSLSASSKVFWWRYYWQSASSSSVCSVLTSSSRNNNLHSSIK